MEPKGFRCSADVWLGLLSVMPVVAWPCPVRLCLKLVWSVWFLKHQNKPQASSLMIVVCTLFWKRICVEEAEMGQFWTPFPVTDVCEQLSQYTRKKHLYSQKNMCCYPSGSMWGGKQNKGWNYGENGSQLCWASQNCQRVAEDPQNLPSSPAPRRGSRWASPVLPQLREENIRGLGRVSQKRHNCKHGRKSKSCGVPPSREEGARGGWASQHQHSAKRKRRPARSISPFQPHSGLTSTRAWSCLVLKCPLLQQVALPQLLACLLLWWVESVWCFL